MPSLSSTYRPQTFADVTDQQNIKQTLRLEVQTGKIGHAYLFSGPRGVGKTTTARIFAKALNCLNPKDGEPCNACDSCRDIDAGSQLDVIEMDAASNTGVDNVRSSIIEHVRFIPQRKHKIYILDEAHMLSASAWNAMLKTIEEPPSYAVFLFLTTEIHKVPATIMSRCQRFDFQRISDASLAERIHAIAKAEKVNVAPEVVKTIVSKSDGCLRDAESLLGQLLVLGEKEITSDVANLVLPVSQLPLAAKLVQLWSTRQLGASLAFVQQLEDRGVSLFPLFDDLIQCIRFLLLGADADAWKKKLADGDEGERKLSALVGVFAPDELSKMALMLMERRRDAKQGADARFCLELSSTAVVTGLLKSSQHTNTAASSVISPTPIVGIQDEKKNSSELDSRLRGNDKQETVVPSPAPSAPTPPQLKAEVKIEPVTAPVIGASAEAPMKASPSSQEGAEGVLVSLADVQSKWPAFMRLMDEKSKSLTFVMKITHPSAVHGSTVVISFQYAYHREKIVADTKAKHLVESCLREVLGADVVIDGVVETESDESREARSQDIVSNILKAFGGQIVDAESPAGSST
jgi:DNA polymerase-3 subunit gamma/tau